MMPHPNIWQCSRGQSAMYDAIIFFILIMIASTVILVFSTYSARNSAITGISHDQEFVDVALLTLTRSTVNDSSYRLISDSNLTHLANWYISDLLVKDLILRGQNSVDTVTLHDGLEMKVKEIGNNLTIPQHRYILESSLENRTGQKTTINIRADGVSALPNDRLTANMRLEIASPYEATVSFRLYCWKN
jgi:hypothetical protein